MQLVGIVQAQASLQVHPEWRNLRNLLRRLNLSWQIFLLLIEVWVMYPSWWELVSEQLVIQVHLMEVHNWNSSAVGVWRIISTVLYWEQTILSWIFFLPLLLHQTIVNIKITTSMLLLIVDKLKGIKLGQFLCILKIKKNL